MQNIQCKEFTVSDPLLFPFKDGLYQCVVVFLFVADIVFVLLAHIVFVLLAHIVFVLLAHIDQSKKRDQ